MPNVEFDTDVNSAAPASSSGSGFQYSSPGPKQNGMTGWLVSKGASARIANMILLAIVLAAFAATYFLLHGSASSSPKPASLESLYRLYGRP